MKIPSVKVIRESGVRTLRRFPFVLADAALGTIAALILVDWTGEKTSAWWQLNDLFIAATPGVALFLAASLLAEKRKWKPGISLGFEALVVVLLVSYSFTLPDDIYSPPYFFAIRHWLLLGGVHLLVAFAPFAGRGEVNGFWQYNKTLFLRLITSLMYTGVLWAGLSIALAAVDNLFLVEVRPERYAELGIFLLGVFNTWFFLSGIPENLDRLEEETSYPKGLRVFTQYVLIPLVLVYLCILYAYVFKIILEWDWPKGWVANLVLGFSVTGIFSLLLVHPLRGREGYSWISRVARGYYVVLIPLIVVLFLAIYRRIAEYGITENRYFVVTLGIWLAAMTIYFVIARSPSIKVIPASLCIASVLVAFGPWGAFQVSERSQIGRLSVILSSNGVLREGRVFRAEEPLPLADAREVSSIIRYLWEVHGPDGLQPWFGVSLDTVGGGGSRRTYAGETGPRELVELLGIRYVSRSEFRSSGPRWLAVDKASPYDVVGYSRCFPGVILSTSGGRSVTLPDQGDTLVLALQGRRLCVALRQARHGRDSIAIDLGDFTQQRYREYPDPSALPAERMIIDSTVGGKRLRILVRSVRSKGEDGGAEIDRFEGSVLLGEMQR